MKVIEASVEFVHAPSEYDMYKTIERAGRTCYKSEDNMSVDSSEIYIRSILKRGHEAVIEHGVVTVKFICDRGVSHEIVRHRLASYCQESTRYCNYSQDKFGNKITVIKPCYWEESSDEYQSWENACSTAEDCYFDLLAMGASPQEARAVLPNSLKTEIVVTMNMREWRHFFKLRCSQAAHPQIREVALIALRKFKERYPVLFEDIEYGD